MSTDDKKRNNDKEQDDGDDPDLLRMGCKDEKLFYSIKHSLSIVIETEEKIYYFLIVRKICIDASSKGIVIRGMVFDTVLIN